jgi:glutamate synthase domain-containing protein 2
MRYLPIALAVLGCLIFGTLIGQPGHWVRALFALCALLTALGIWDMLQAAHSLRRNYPILANLRFLLEKIRPEIRQYFLESDLDGAPFNRSKRAVVYQRSKGQIDKRPFGTQLDVYGEDYEWLTHSIAPRPVKNADFRITVGGPDCTQRYSLSVLNISAMSFGALSANAIRALNRGARLGGFAHDTGEGSYSVHHREFGGDIIWEIGSGYFGCRHPDGSFDPEKFRQQAAEPQIRMIEIKLSQGAKPGHGGVLPGAKVTPEIAAARGVPVGQDCISPARHSAFSTPLEMMAFIAQLRALSGGKPVGFKLCIGHRSEFMALVKAMLASGVVPDFIVIDGKEGGTGAAPLEFTDHLGTPLRDGLVFAHNCLLGAGLRGRVKLGAAGRIITAFDMLRVFALGADWCNSARGFMFALGCVQSLSCHTDRCPTGVATQNPWRQQAIVVPLKAERVARFHDNTLKALAELVGAAGLDRPGAIHRSMIMHRKPPHEGATFAEIYPELRAESLLRGEADASYQQPWALARAESFTPAPG